MSDVVVAATAYLNPQALVAGAIYTGATVLDAVKPVLRGRIDYLTGVRGEGVGRISGTVKDKGTPNLPVSERVVLLRQKDLLPIREMWSDPTTGVYQFDYVDELQKYVVISFDHDLNHRAVVADNLTPDIIT
ncbi:hypothetical protein LJR175_004394 [Variovorax sp. LjRoot175]|uniref:hypothetical protein n=1 Tax=Variovorax sp. LjRoot175 TaxID=3342276 RepID=UPI003ED0C7B7